MICCYADELKEGFYPWVEQVRALFLFVVTSTHLLHW